MSQKNENPALTRGVEQANLKSEAPASIESATTPQAARPAPLKLGLVANAASDDPFDLAKLRVSQEFLETAGVRKLLTTVPVRRPGAQEFFRVHPSPDYRETFAFLEFKDEREIFLVNLREVPELQSECYLATLHTVVNRSGVLSMWPVRVPGGDGRRPLDWHTSAIAGAENAMTRWTKIKANMALKAYEIFEAENQNVDPAWPNLTFDAIYRIAFKDGPITSLDHPAVKRLRG